MKVVIIGGGITGLTTAYRLARAGDKAIDFQLLEAGDRLGGVISTLRYSHFIVEEGPDSFITTKPAALELCRELGLSGEIIPTNPEFRRAFIASAGKLSPIPEGFTLLVPTRLWSFFNSDLLSWRGKLRAACEIFQPARSSHDDESLRDFVVRRFGKELFDAIAQPLVGGIYTADAKKLSAAATVPQFVALEERYGSVTGGLIAEKKIDLLSFVSGLSSEENSTGGGARYSIFVTLRSGLSALVDKLAGSLTEERILLGSAVKSVRRVNGAANHGGWLVELSDGGEIEADKIVACVSAACLGELTRSSLPDLSAALLKLESASSVVANLMFDRAKIKHSMNGFGFVVPETENSPLLACSFSSVKFPGRAGAGKTMLRVFMGGALHPQIMDLSDSSMLQMIMRELSNYLDISSLPEKVWIKRWWHSMPQYNVGHSAGITQICNELAAVDLFWAGNAIDGVGIPDCVRSGNDAASRILAEATIN